MYPLRCVGLRDVRAKASQQIIPLPVIELFQAGAIVYHPKALTHSSEVDKPQATDGHFISVIVWRRDTIRHDCYGRINAGDFAACQRELPEILPQFVLAHGVVNRMQALCGLRQIIYVRDWCIAQLGDEGIVQNVGKGTRVCNGNILLRSEINALFNHLDDA